MASDFNKAFAKARKEKGANSTFVYQGKSYSTNTKEDTVKAKMTTAPKARPFNKTSSVQKEAPTVTTKPSSKLDNVTKYFGTKKQDTSSDSKLIQKANLKSVDVKKAKDSISDSKLIKKAKTHKTEKLKNDIAYVMGSKTKKR
jgi:hypothetical protein